MAYNFSPFKEKIKQITEWLQREYTGIRTGQAAPAILDNITVEIYGSQMPIRQIANVGIEDARTLKITPWDSSHVKDIERAITTSGLGLSVVAKESDVRISFPQLTAERRTALVKLAKEKMEEGRISIRKERERVLKELEAKKEEGTMTEDDARRAQNDLQKLVDDANKQLEETKNRKEKEIGS